MPYLTVFCWIMQVYFALIREASIHLCYLFNIFYQKKASFISRFTL